MLAHWLLTSTMKRGWYPSMCTWTWMYCTVRHRGAHVRQNGFLWQSWLSACRPQAAVPTPTWCQSLIARHTHTHSGKLDMAAKLFSWTCVCLTLWPFRPLHSVIKSNSTGLTCTSSPSHHKQKQPKLFFFFVHANSWSLQRQTWESSTT